MASLLKKLRPGVPSVVVDDGGGCDSNFEFSIAEEYKGPPLSYFIPEVPAFKLDQIPVAPIASSPPHHQSSLVVPVIQPIRKSSNATTKLKDGGNEDHKHGVVGLNLISKNSDTAEESGSCSASVSSEIFSCKAEDEDMDDPSSTPTHVKRNSAVKFRDPDSNEMVDDDYNDDEVFSGSEYESGISTPIMNYVRPIHAVRPGKKGTCYRCLRGNRFTQREVCIVCSAKYCRKCVLRAMGSMPEGRKCLTCIGQRIDETKRRNLGNFSRMLKSLLSDCEVKQIMNDEMFCEANQIPAEQVVVNGERLERDKLMLLLTCRYPPKELKPGFYWYDKSAGLWGKEGQRPCQIISPDIDVGGSLQKNASRGKTRVTVNGREITKEELWILKLAGVKWDGPTDFWVTADGSYVEVGHRNVKGRIWDKFGAKVALAFLSLSFPPNLVTTPSEGEGKGEGVNGGSQDNNHQQKMLHKFLLVGSAKSGTSTIFKQAKHLYNVPFSENERQTIKLVIQSNLFTYLGMLLEGCEYFEERSLLEKTNTEHVDESTSSEENSGEIIETTNYSISPRLQGFSDWLIKYMVSGNLDTIFRDIIQNYGPMVEELWSDPAIQATYNRRHELKLLPRNATYFLDRAVEISKINYEPSDMDIMYAEGITLSNSITSMEFSFPVLSGDESLDHEYQHDPSLRYELIRADPTSLGAKCRLLDIFEDIDVVLFSIALTDYDEYIVESNGVVSNKMLLAKQLFENIITYRSFNNKKFLLLLTKYDLLEEKIEEASLTKCEWFCDFNPVISHNQKKGRINDHTNSPPLAQRAFQYIAMKFKTLFKSLTERKLFVSLVTGLEPDTIDEALRYAREVMVWEKWDPSAINKSEITSTTIDEATLT
ncbi:extra-large guanine nucleotide-binding protein 1-like [Arachis stenosperma]|uniref:extra-large guanine nucleotide-binding protein 1-like n=1 Tax=Arachis stenosperma TaxID=217475 RepID=UPI0025AC68A4|nr:extra-large guanine nucleotide-binding protein 1-like [Arachis stenosperma]